MNGAQTDKKPGQLEMTCVAIEKELSGIRTATDRLSLALTSVRIPVSEPEGPNAASDAHERRTELHERVAGLHFQASNLRQQLETLEGEVQL